MKRLFVSLALGLSLTLTPPLAAGEVTVDGRAVEAAATVRENTTYVSLRAVVQALAPEAGIQWTGSCALAEGEDFTLTAQPGNCWLEVNGRALYVPQGVLLEEGRTLVPGYIDLHVHITGGGGEQGPTSRVPESQLSVFVENGITTGTSATTFNPDNAVTRSQAVTFQWRAAGSPVVSGSAFDDVTDNAYYAEAVTWALASGITNGTDGNKFSPNAAVSRAQAVTFLWRELAE